MDVAVDWVYGQSGGEFEGHVIGEECVFRVGVEVMDAKHEQYVYRHGEAVVEGCCLYCSGSCGG
jgi:hypothetical protein